MFKSQKPREDDGDDLLAVLFCLADSSDYSDEETESRTYKDIVIQERRFY